ncbi:UNVERIFIED_CONTAM: hypothetical protein PYX00_009315 [Menopon gallinae]|uniref:H15 domain-containing protein n=1 Tax=Menopon gallinae TaxID=328185 RepID=A0AAW2HBE2_9NEOP
MTQFVCKLWDRVRRVLGSVPEEEANFHRSSYGPRTLDFVQSAIYNLADRNGSKYKDILDYLCSQYEVDENTIRGRVMTAIRRGVLIGVLEQDGNNYRLARFRERKRHRWRNHHCVAQPQKICVNCHKQRMKSAKQDDDISQEPLRP